MRAYAVLGICVLSLGLSAPAYAASPSLESRARAAQRACLTGNPASGVELLTDLYLDTQDPTYIYNQGRCYEMNRRYEDAIGRFREYMVKARKMTRREKADTEKRIADCQSYLSSPKPEPSPSSVPPKPEPPPAVEPVPPTSPANPVVSAGHPAAPTPVPSPMPVPALQQHLADRPGSSLRTAGLVTGAVGVVALVGGVILNLKVNSMSSDLEKQYNYSRDTDSTRKDYKTAGWVSYGVGATCLAGGALLYYFGWRAGASAAIEPIISFGLAGAAVRGDF